jgi:methionyl-tRNA formyltransferase
VGKSNKTRILHITFVIRGRIIVNKLFNSVPRLQIVYFGMESSFSLPPLRMLLVAGFSVNAVILPAEHNSQEPHPQLVSRSRNALAATPERCAANSEIIDLATRNDVPVWLVSRLADQATTNLLAGFEPDVICIACFPSIFPSGLLTLPRYGCFNLHPSLLPAYRGPEPLFWVAYHDERVTGVSLHMLDTGIDSGDIIAQAIIKRPDGMTGSELEQQCAETGGNLLVDALMLLAQGESLPKQSQVVGVGSYFTSPGPDDLIVPTHWPARRAYNFINGADQWPLSIQLGGDQYRIRVAKSFAPEHQLEQPYILLADELWVQFDPGVLRLKIF